VPTAWVLGVNILNCLYRADEANLPVAFEIVHKDLQYCEVETRKLRRHSSVTKNEHLRQMLRTRGRAGKTNCATAMC